MTPPKTLEWIGDHDGHLRLIDQTRLPTDLVYLDCRTVQDVWDAIKRLSVRGAPAIGVSAAYGVVIGLHDSRDLPRPKFDQQLAKVCDFLAESRPTAVNLFWALERMQRTAHNCDALSSPELHDRLLAEARTIEAEDQQMCTAIGRHGATLLESGTGVLTHCNAGALATAGEGTALSLFFEAARQGKTLQVYADETRPLNQGSRLTTWELMQRDIPVTLICDSMAASVMQSGKIQAVVTGADRIAANGDAANKIGTYSIAVLAKAHNIPFYVAAPTSTFDMAIASGAEIPIEERAADEVTNSFGSLNAPEGVSVYNPAFDVTPASLITAIVTQNGIIAPINEASIQENIRGHA